VYNICFTQILLFLLYFYFDQIEAALSILDFFQKNPTDLMYYKLACVHLIYTYVCIASTCIYRNMHVLLI